MVVTKQQEPRNFLTSQLLLVVLRIPRRLFKQAIYQAACAFIQSHLLLLIQEYRACMARKRVKPSHCFTVESHLIME